MSSATATASFSLSRQRKLPAWVEPILVLVAAYAVIPPLVRRICSRPFCCRSLRCRSQPSG